MADDRPHNCPLCGGDLAKHGLMVSLEADIALVDGVVIKLGPALAPLLYMLADRQYAFVPTDDLYRAVYGALQPESPTIYKLMNNLRKVLSDTAWQICSRRQATSGRTDGGDTGYMLCRRAHVDLDLEKVSAATAALADLGLTDGDASRVIEAALPMRRP